MLPIRDDRDNKKRTREDRATRLLVRFPNCRARHLLEEVVGEPDYSAVGTLSFVLLLSQCLCTKVPWVTWTLNLQCVYWLLQLIAQCGGEEFTHTSAAAQNQLCIFDQGGGGLPCISLNNNTSKANCIGVIPKHQWHQCHINELHIFFTAVEIGMPRFEFISLNSLTLTTRSQEAALTAITETCDPKVLSLSPCWVIQSLCLCLCDFHCHLLIIPDDILFPTLHNMLVAMMCVWMDWMSGQMKWTGERFWGTMNKSVGVTNWQWWVTKGSSRDGTSENS